MYWRTNYGVIAYQQDSWAFEPTHLLQLCAAARALNECEPLIFSGHLGVCHVPLQLLQPVLSRPAGSAVTQLGLDPLQLIVQLLQIVQ